MQRFSGQVFYCQNRRPSRVLAAAVVLAFVVAGSGIAQTTVVSTEQPDLASKPALAIANGEVQLSLEEAKAIALERNLTLIVERYTTEEADLFVKQNRGIYDVFSTVDMGQSEDSAPTASNLAGAEVQEFKQRDWNFGFDQLISTGGNVFLDWNNNRTETNSLFATLNPAYRIDLDLSLSQPLLRNAGKLATNRNITIARTNRSISLENFERQVTAVLLAVEEAYWNLAESIAQLEVAMESEALAVQLHEQNKIRVEVGTLAPLELVQSEAGVADRVVEIIRARASVGDRADVLRQLLNIERSEDLWSMPINPNTDPFSEPFEVDVESAIETALAERPELRSKMLSLSNQELDVRYFRNQQRPRLDLNVTYGLNGVGGDTTDRDFLTQEILSTSQGDYGDAIDQILNADFDGWRAALNFAYPIQNRTAEANRAIAEVNYNRGQAEFQDIELAVVTEVRRVARLLEASAEAVESAGVSRRLEEKNYEAEQKRYENGMSTSFQVLRIQEDLTGARSRFVAAVAAYRRALALHYQSIGKLIEVSGVSIVGEERVQGGEEPEA
jgi:outer membrane protein TolC